MAQTSSELVAKYSSKASGVYREIIDATAEPLNDSTQNVVVVGQFENGPIMRPVLCKNSTIAHAIFGRRSTKLEAKGNYGMLMAEHVLEQGPVYILNLKNIDQYNETLQVKQLAVNSAEKDALVAEPIATVYDTNKFWKVDKMYGTYGDGPVLSFASVLQGKVTVLVEKYWSSNYNYTVAKTKEYNESFTADGLDDNDFVNDYLIRVHVFKTDLKTAKLSVANCYINGMLNMSVLDKIKEDANAQYFATYVGTIGDVIDINGNNLNIATVMNADEQASGVHVALNYDAIAMNSVDLLAKQAIKFSETGEAMPTVEEASRLGHTFVPVLKPICVYMSDSVDNVGYMFDSAPVAVGQVIADDEKTVRVLDKRYIDNIYTLPESIVPGSKAAPVMPDGQPFPVNADGIPVYPATSPKASQLVTFNEENQAVWPYRDFVQVTAKWATNVEIEAPESAHDIVTVWNVNGNLYEYKATAAAGTATAFKTAMTEICKALLDEHNVTATSTVTGETTMSMVTEATALPKGMTQISMSSIVVDGVEVAINKVGNSSTIGSYSLSELSQPIVVSNGKVTYDSNTVDIDVDAVARVYGKQKAVYEILFSESIKSKFTSLSGMPTLTNGGQYGTSKFESINGAHIAITPYCFNKLENWYESASTADMHVIQGIVSLEKHFVNGTAARQNAILDRLADSAFTASFGDPTIFRCRYMIDTFKTYIEPNAKYQFANLASACNRFPVITPGPFYHELRTSKNPDFHDLLGNFDMSIVAQGSNPDRPSTNSFSFCNTGDAAKFLFPVENVEYSDGFSANKIIPGTGIVGKAYYSKLSGTRKVYDIVAGPEYALSAKGVVGPEFDAGPDDRKAMQQIGINVIQKINGVLQLRCSKTAYNTVISAFNYPETLEKCLYVSDEVEPTLSGKIFKYNNDSARLEVKKRADAVCQLMVSDGVIADYENKCDLENNPVEVRKAGIIVLDTILYNEYGIAIAVHRTTVKDPEE